MGRRFDPDVLAVVTGSAGDVHPQLDAMRAFDLVHPDPRTGEYLFRHALIQDALYDSLLRAQRSGLHLRIAQEIERRSAGRLIEVAEVLAHHFALTEQVERAVEYLTLAGEKNLRVYSLDEAEVHLEQARALAEHHVERVEQRLVLRLLTLLAELLLIQFQPRQLKQLVDRHQHLLDQVGDSPGVVLVLSHYAFAATMMREYGAASLSADRSLQMALRIGDDRCRAYARGSFLMAHATICDQPLAEMERTAELAIGESELADDAYLHSWVRLPSAWDYMLRGLNNQAHARSRELEERGRQMADPRATAMHLWIDGWINLLDERWDDAHANSERCLACAITDFDRQIGLYVKGISQLFLGRAQEGLASLIRQRAEAEGSGWFYSQVGIDGPIGVGMVLCGDFARGLAFVERAIATRGGPWRYARCGDAARLCG